MADFSSFFPTAGGGGGGFTKQKKYSTNRAVDATHKLPPPQFVGGEFSNLAIGATTLTNYQTSTPLNYQVTANEVVGATFVHNSTTHTVTSNTAYTANTASFTVTFTPGLTATIAYGTTVTITNPSTITVNPASDLGLTDNSQIGYFMVGGGSSGYVANYVSRGGYGGNVLQGMATITTAATDLVLTPGSGGGATSYGGGSFEEGDNSTISGGLTLTTADGTNAAGAEGAGNQSSYVSVVTAAGNGINGYGGGGTANTSNYGPGPGRDAGVQHGYGRGSYGKSSSSYVGGDGCIILYY